MPYMVPEEEAHDEEDEEKFNSSVSVSYDKSSFSVGAELRSIEQKQ